jgi:hypothetical protein
VVSLDIGQKSMSDLNFFVHTGGSKGLVEVALERTAIVRDLLVTLDAMGAGKVDGEILVFLDEGEVPLRHDAPLCVDGAAPGARLHLVRCRHVTVEVFYLHHAIKRSFAPGAKLRRVKEWAVRELGVAAGDALEHVLQLHGSADRPNSATPLSALAAGCGCAVSLDLVPDKRVEG